MSTTIPIKDKEKLEIVKNYYLERKAYRNQALIILGLNTALRIGDMLSLKWKDVYNANKHCFHKHIALTEQKTGKYSCIALNKASVNALWTVIEQQKIQSKPNWEETYIFSGRNHTNLPISRIQAYRIVQAAAAAAGYKEHISCHSLRKTFGYHAWQQGVTPVMLMNIYNHSSFQVTKRYLCIDQEERDEVFLNIDL